jgi:hypothetical protein
VGHNTQFADYRTAGRFSAPRGESLLRGFGEGKAASFRRRASCQSGAHIQCGTAPYLQRAETVSSTLSSLALVWEGSLSINIKSSSTCGRHHHSGLLHHREVPLPLPLSQGQVESGGILPYCWAAISQRRRYASGRCTHRLESLDDGQYSPLPLPSSSSSVLLSRPPFRKRCHHPASQLPPAQTNGFSTKNAGKITMSKRTKKKCGGTLIQHH